MGREGERPGQQAPGKTLLRGCLAVTMHAVRTCSAEPGLFSLSMGKNPMISKGLSERTKADPENRFCG